MDANQTNDNSQKPQRRDSRNIIRSTAVANSIWDACSRVQPERENATTIRFQTEIGSFCICRLPHMVSITFATDDLVVKATIGPDKEAVKFKGFKRFVDPKCEDLEQTLLTVSKPTMIDENQCQDNGQARDDSSCVFLRSNNKGFRQCTVLGRPDYTPTPVDGRIMDAIIYEVVTQLPPSGTVAQVSVSDLPADHNITTSAA